MEASIDDLQRLLTSGHTNSVELVAKHLNRIAQFDRRGLLLNAIPIINRNLFEDAQASDDRRAMGQAASSLEGIPCTIKDSYKIKSMPVAAGSPAFRSLVATDDAFTVKKIKEGGAVIIGRTNMPPMAAGGMQRGVYGRAESPYSKEYLTAAFASGSSNGSATATAARFGVFGMGEETISSGRSPASNNALVAYTPSRGIISIRGNWPLFPSCDTVVPHTRTLKDMFHLLDVIVATDADKSGDFWRGQPFIKLPDPDIIRPASYHELADENALAGRKIGVPRIYIGGQEEGVQPVHVSESVKELWKQARTQLESLGAIVEEVDFPLVKRFEEGTWVNSDGSKREAPAYPDDIDMMKVMAYAWDDFLIENNDTTSVTTLADVDPSTIFPPPPGSLRDRYDPTDFLARHADVVAEITGGRTPLYEIPGLEKGLQALENKRKLYYEDWLVEKGLDLVVWPCAGDVGRADADVNEESAKHAWKNGVLYSNGNCAIRQLGVPTVSVPMGLMSDTKMPVNLTFSSKAYDDNNIFRYAYAFETAAKARHAPSLTPVLPTDAFASSTPREMSNTVPPGLTAEFEVCSTETRSLKLRGTIDASNSGGLEALLVYVDGTPVDHVRIHEGSWEAEAEIVQAWKGRQEEAGVPNPNLALIVVLASAKNGRSTGKLIFA